MYIKLTFDTSENSKIRNWFQCNAKVDYIDVERNKITVHFNDVHGAKSVANDITLRLLSFARHNIFNYFEIIDNLIILNHSKIGLKIKD